MTFCSGGSPVGWGRGAKGSKGRERVPLDRRVLLNKKVPLGRIVVF